MPWERLESCKVVQDLSGSFFPRKCWFKPLDGIYSGLILSSEVVKLVSVNSNPYFQFRRDDRLSCHGIKKTTLKLTTETLKTNSNSLKVVIFAFLATQAICLILLLWQWQAVLKYICVFVLGFVINDQACNAVFPDGDCVIVSLSFCFMIFLLNVICVSWRH